MGQWLVFAAAEPEGITPAAQIDALLARDWQQHSLQGNAPASDEIFVRRIHLDLVGRIPTHEETVQFLNDPVQDKRGKLIVESQTHSHGKSALVPCPDE